METSPELIRWFGNSKVVDASGNPLPMYHGTDSQFDTFMPDKVGSNFGLDTIGFFFTSDRDSANRSRKSYPNKSKFHFDEADKVAATSGYILKVYLKIEHPLYARDIPGFYSTGGGLSSTNLYDSNREKVSEALATGKYDGFLLKAEGSLLAIVLDPSQIKSVDSVGFTDSHNIYESKFTRFVGRFSEYDPALVESILSGYSVLFESEKAPRVLWHGTDQYEVLTDTPESIDIQSEMSELNALARKYNVADPAAIYSILKRNSDMRIWNVPQSDIELADGLTTSLSGKLLAQGKPTSRTRRTFDDFRFPDMLEIGIHFGSRAQAEMFGKAFPFRVDIRNPLRLRDLGNWNPSAVVKELQSRGLKIPNGMPANNAADIRKIIRALGYDGVIYRNEAEGFTDSYIALSGNQIHPLADDQITTM